MAVWLIIAVLRQSNIIYALAKTIKKKSAVGGHINPRRNPSAAAATAEFENGYAWYAFPGTVYPY